MDGYRLRKFTIIHCLYLCDGPAHIVQWPTGKTPGAPDGQSAIGMHLFCFSTFIRALTQLDHQFLLQGLHTFGFGNDFIGLLKCFIYLSSIFGQVWSFVLWTTIFSSFSSLSVKFNLPNSHLFVFFSSEALYSKSYFPILQSAPNQNLIQLSPLTLVKDGWYPPFIVK